MQLVACKVGFLMKLQFEACSSIGFFFYFYFKKPNSSNGAHWECCKCYKKRLVF